MILLSQPSNQFETQVVHHNEGLLNLYNIPTLSSEKILRVRKSATSCHNGTAPMTGCYVGMRRRRFSPDRRQRRVWFTA